MKKMKKEEVDELLEKIEKLNIESELLKQKALEKKRANRPKKYKKKQKERDSTTLSDVTDENMNISNFPGSEKANEESKQNG